MHPKKNSGVGLHIAAARKRAGLTQEELAERLHVTRQTISNYEGMRSQPDIQMLAQLAKCLQVPVEELIYGRGGSQYCSRAYIGMSGFCRNLGIIVYVLGVLYGIRLGSGAQKVGESGVSYAFTLWDALPVWIGALLLGTVLLALGRILRLLEQQGGRGERPGE